jgi:hypothetical protein
MHVCLLIADRYWCCCCCCCCCKSVYIFYLLSVLANTMFVAFYVGNGRSALPIATGRRSNAWLDSYNMPSKCYNNQIFSLRNISGVALYHRSSGAVLRYLQITPPPNNNQTKYWQTTKVTVTTKKHTPKEHRAPLGRSHVHACTLGCVRNFTLR